MNRNLIVIGVAVLVIVAGGIFAFSPRSLQDTQTKMSEEDMNSGDIGGSMEMTEDHMQAMDDGQTIMAMGGKFNPQTLYVAPGQEIKVANHEAQEITIIAEDGSFESKTIEPGAEVVGFTAPDEPGAYIYYSPLNPEIKGTLVVEE